MEELRGLDWPSESSKAIFDVGDRPKVALIPPRARVGPRIALATAATEPSQPKRLMKIAGVMILILLLASVSLTHAHDIRGFAERELTSASPALATAMAATPAADFNTRGVLNNLQKWPVPRKITICFVSGSSTLRARVTEAMRRLWPIGELSLGRLDFDATSFEKRADCGPKPSVDIRVDFAAGGGYWSYVGIESLRHTPSMNLDGFTETTPQQEEFDGKVGHEMGHALGLEHEHQSPAAPIDCGWNFDYIRAAYVWANDDEMYSNFKHLQNTPKRKSYDFTSYDKRSLMHYSFEPQAYKAGTKSPCFAPVNKIPSDLDLSAIRLAYSAKIQVDQELARQAIPGLWKKFSNNELRYLLTIKQDLLVK